MFCQVCGTHQKDDAEYCAKCGHKLLVLSGTLRSEEQTFEAEDDNFSFDEHLLERISILEEVLKRTGETVRNILSALHKQEENILINHAGLVALRDLLEEKGLIGRDEWSDLWESKMDYQLLCLEKRERFSDVKDKIAALFEGSKRKLFLQYLEEAEYALYAFNLEKAIAALEASFKLDRTNYELAHFLGETYFNQNEVDRALGFFSRVLESKPDHYEGLVYSGVIHHQRGDASRAEEFLKRATALYPDNFLPQFSLGAVYASQGQLTRAVVYLENAVQIDPVPHALYLLGNCFYEMGKLGPAIDYLAEAVKLDPAFEECYHLLGLCYLDRQWTKKALDAFRQAQQLNPKKMRYEDMIGFLSGQEARSLPAIGEEAARFASQAEEQLRLNHPNRALECYAKAVAVEPENPTLLMSYALACLHLNRNQESKSITQRVLDLNPGEMLRATAYATMIEVLRSEGKYREGNHIGKLLLDEGASDFSRTIAYYEIAYNLAEMEEDLDEALQYARWSLESSPDELKQFPLAVLGWVHYKRHEFEEAIGFLSRSAELGPSAATMTHLGMALLASGDEQQAKTVLDDARRLSDRGGALEEKMMEFMRDSAKILERIKRD
jgi:tetratricopeptide (TPR) repeat protein